MSRNKKITYNHNAPDLQKLLEILCNTNEIEWKIKILSSMTEYIISNKINCKMIVTHQPMYEELQYVLSKSLSLSNMTTSLYFIVALLSIDDGKGFDERSLKVHAQNALRISGCLATMAELFVRNMMYQDIWIAVCRSFAEACRGSEPNQTYCSSLVRLCVRKCQQGKLEASAVLQSLLHNHDRNIDMFLDCDGPSIFTRNTLQFDACLQLLDTLAQRSHRATNILLIKTNVVYDLRDYLNLYGPDSKIGQWATIILYHINSWCTINEINVTEIHKNNSGQNTHGNDDSEPKDVKKLDEHNLNETKEVLQNTVREISYRQLQKHNKNKTVRNPERFLNNASHCGNLDDTEELMQKIAGELAYENMLNKRQFASKQTVFERQKDNVLASKPRNGNGNAKQITTENPRITALRYCKDSNGNLELAKGPRKNPFISQNTHVIARGKTFDTRKSEDSEESDHLSFSYLIGEEENTGNRRVYRADREQNCFVAKPTLTTRQFTHNYKNAKISSDKITTSQTLHSFNYVTNSTRNDDQSSVVNTRVFKPTFTSTPRRKSESAVFAPESRISSKIQESSRTSFKRSKASLASNLKTRRYLQPSATEKLRKTSTASSVKAAAVKKRQSMSARLFSAINESCTTFVKSVKGIFRASENKTKDQTRDKDRPERNNTSVCTLSFTNYMRKRDAAEANEGTKRGETEYDFSMVANSLNINSCKTCNETIFLQQKLKTDENLRKTIMKLKYGINLYGCDFKKISKTLWPTDKFMTQQVLYDLYRKLLAK